MATEDRLLTIDEATEILSLSKDFLYPIPSPKMR